MKLDVAVLLSTICDCQDFHVSFLVESRIESFAATGFYACLQESCLKPSVILATET